EYQAGHPGAALDAMRDLRDLRRGLTGPNGSSEDTDSYEKFVLALVNSKVDGPLARAYFDAADRSMRRFRYGDFELHFLRAKALEVVEPAGETVPRGRRGPASGG